MAMLVQKSSPIIRKVERILKPRLLFMTVPFAEKIIGLFVLLFSSFILLPIPFSNLIPGLGVLIISFGLLGKDGLVIILGMTVGMTGVFISVATIILGVEAISFVKSFLF